MSAIALRTWTRLAVLPPGETNAAISLDPLRRMVAAAERDAVSAAQRLGDLIEQSGRLLFPGVGDPLSANLEIGSHRWLQADREETYSDWLAWVLQRQEDPARVLPLFGVDGRRDVAKPWRVEREVVTPWGRLDLLLRHSQMGVLCVEVKTQSHLGEDQLERYLKVLARERSSLGLVVLAMEDERPCTPHYFCSWKQVALSLRTWARDWLRDGKLYDAVMTLAFCGAIERNLLSLGGSGLNALRTADYLEEVLNERDHETTT